MNVEQRAKEFCDGAFGPLGVDTTPYTKIIAELIQGAVDQERERCARIAESIEPWDLLDGDAREELAAAIRNQEADESR